MEIISKKSSFPILGLIILESFVMFLSSVGCGWIIYHFLPNLFEVDFLFSIKASVLGMLFLGWILFCPKCISQKIWGLMLISLSGGIFFSIFFYIYGIKCCLWACALIVSEFVIGLLLGSMFKNKISASLFLKIVAFIFIPTFLIYAIMVFCSGTFFCYEPIYVMFMLLGLLHLTFIYSKKEEYPKLERKVKVENCKLKSEEDNINNVIYSNDTSNYKDITYNKKDETIKLFDKFDEYIISIGKDIIRNYLLKNVVYKLKKRFIEVRINQNDLYICFLKDVKQFDLQNKLKLRKGYENTSLNFYLRVKDISNLEYAFKLAKELYDYLKKPQEPSCELLFKKISNKIVELGDNIVCNKLYRDYRFKSKRNFISISKRKYGLYVRLLKVEDNQNILDYTYQTGAEPLCMTYKIFNENDIETIIPYIKKSYMLSRCVAIDVKNELNKLYLIES